MAASLRRHGTIAARHRHRRGGVRRRLIINLVLHHLYGLQLTEQMRAEVVWGVFKPPHLPLTRMGKGPVPLATQAERRAKRRKKA